MDFVFALILAFLIAGLIGSKRKIGFGWSLAACIFLSPIIGLIITLCSEKLPPEDEVIEGVEEKPLTEVLAESNEKTEESPDVAPVEESAPVEAVSNEDSTPIDY